MGTGRKFNKNPATRPKKQGAARVRREKVHRERLIALGMTESAVNKLTAKEVRTLLQRPVKTRAAIEAGKLG